MLGAAPEGRTKGSRKAAAAMTRIEEILGEEGVATLERGLSHSKASIEALMKQFSSMEYGGDSTPREEWSVIYDAAPNGALDNHIWRLADWSSVGT